MHRHTLIATLASAALGGIALAPQAAHAQWVVIDPANLAQNLMTAANTLEQINNQVKQLQNQAQTLRNQERNLAGLDYSAVPQLRSTLSASNRLIQQGQGLAFDVSRMDGDLARLYPAQSSAADAPWQMAQDAHTRWRYALEALRTATRVQSQAVQNLDADERVMVELVSRSDSATGALQAMQATNQLLALQSRQAMQAQQLRITQDRAAALEQARQAAAQESAREVRRRFLGSGTPYTPGAVSFYSNP